MVNFHQLQISVYRITSKPLDQSSLSFNNLCVFTLQGETYTGQMEFQGLAHQKGSYKFFKYADDVT